jgi:iron complex transport system permease protein
VRELRVPRTELGLLVGAALGAAGALMQGTTRNPLAEPGILGVNAGAAFAVVAAIRFLGVDSVTAYAAFALAGAAISAVLVFALGGSGRGGPTPVRLALAGAVLTALLVSLTSAVLVFDARTLDEFRFWIVRSLNALALGDEVARSLGQHVGRARAAAGAGFVLLAGGAVAAAGPVAFVGLGVPHVARGLVGPDYRWIVPYSVVLGAVLLLTADVLGRVVVRPAELQVGIVTALLGAPFFIWLVRRRRLVAL